MKSKFKSKVKYKSTTMIFSPYGVIPEGRIYTGEEWKNILVYDVGNDFKTMFIVVPDETILKT